MSVRIQQNDFDITAEIAALKRSSDVGAIVTFSGVVRGDHGVTSMTLEHYPGMTEREIARHVDEACARWPLAGITVIHRIGQLAPGDNIVLVVTASSHRRAAFEAAEYLMDYLKTRAPFWKQEARENQTVWVEAKASDDAAAERWR